MLSLVAASNAWLNEVIVRSKSVLGDSLLTYLSHNYTSVNMTYYGWPTTTIIRNINRNEPPYEIRFIGSLRRAPWNPLGNTDDAIIIKPGVYFSKDNLVGTSRLDTLED